MSMYWHSNQVLNPFSSQVIQMETHAISEEIKGLRLLVEPRDDSYPRLSIGKAVGTFSLFRHLPQSLHLTPLMPERRKIMHSLEAVIL